MDFILDSLYYLPAFIFSLMKSIFLNLDAREELEFCCCPVLPFYKLSLILSSRIWIFIFGEFDPNFFFSFVPMSFTLNSDEVIFESSTHFWWKDYARSLFLVALYLLGTLFGVLSIYGNFKCLSFSSLICSNLKLSISDSALILLYIDC